MLDIIKEEILCTIKKKRFIILTALLFVFEIVNIIDDKGDFFNDLIYFFSVQDIITMFFSPFAGVILIISVYRRKYTSKSIVQIKKHHQKRYVGVLARAIAGSVILVGFYVIMAIVVLLIGVIFGAHMTGEQTGALLLRFLTECFASIATYVVALFWLYVFAFPVIPAILYAAMMLIHPIYSRLYTFYSHIGYKIAVIVLPKVTGDASYSTLLMNNLEWRYVGIWILQVAVFLLLTMLVFKLKKYKPFKTKIDIKDMVQLEGDAFVEEELPLE